MVTKHPQNITFKEERIILAHSLNDPNCSEPLVSVLDASGLEQSCSPYYQEEIGAGALIPFEVIHTMI